MVVVKNNNISHSVKKDVITHFSVYKKCTNENIEDFKNDKSAICGIEIWLTGGLKLEIGFTYDEIKQGLFDESLKALEK